VKSLRNYAIEFLESNSCGGDLFEYAACSRFVKKGSTKC